MGRLDGTPLDAVASDAVVRDERDGRGEGMTGGLHLSVRAVRCGGVGWVASGVRWARPLGFSFSVFTAWLALLILFLLVHNLFWENLLALVPL